MAIFHLHVAASLTPGRSPGRSPCRSGLKPGAKLITISSLDLFSRSNYQDWGRYQEVDLSIGADAETLSALPDKQCRMGYG